METMRPFTFWIEDAQKKALRALSKEHDRPIAEIVRESLDEYFEKRKILLQPPRQYETQSE